MRKKTIFISFIFTFLFSCKVTMFANMLNGNLLKQSVRPMGMGGAFLAISDDENVFFYNPAGIVNRDKYLIQLISLNAGLGDSSIGWIDFLLKNYLDLINYMNLSISDQLDLIDKIYSQGFDTNHDIFVSLPNICFIINPIGSGNKFNFGLGVFSCANAMMEFKKEREFFISNISHQNDPAIEIPWIMHYFSLTNIVSLPIGYKILSLGAINLPGVLSLGINLKYMYKFDSFGREPIYNFHSDKQFVQGRSFGVDFGVIYHLNQNFNFAFSLFDIYNTNIQYLNYDCTQINPVVSLGFSYYPEKVYYYPGKYIQTNKNIVFAFDFTDLTSSSNPTTYLLLKKTHFGIECKLLPFILRGGLNCLYPTFGFGIGSNIVQLEYAFYGDEVEFFDECNEEFVHRINFSVKFGNNN